jgi:hypothetical protein
MMQKMITKMSHPKQMALLNTLFFNYCANLKNAKVEGLDLVSLVSGFWDMMASSLSQGYEPEATDCYDEYPHGNHVQVFPTRKKHCCWDYERDKVICLKDFLLGY